MINVNRELSFYIVHYKYMLCISFSNIFLATFLCNFMLLVKIPNVAKDTGLILSLFAISKPNKPSLFPWSIIYFNMKFSISLFEHSFSVFISLIPNFLAIVSSES